MSLVLLGALAANVLKCPSCKETIKKTTDYRANIISIPQIGGPTIREMIGDEVTLHCDACGWSGRTDNWRRFIVLPPEE